MTSGATAAAAAAMEDQGISAEAMLTSLQAALVTVKEQLTEQADALAKQRGVMAQGELTHSMVLAELAEARLAVQAAEAKLAVRDNDSPTETQEDAGSGKGAGKGKDVNVHY